MCRGYSGMVQNAFRSPLELKPLLKHQLWVPKLDCHLFLEYLNFQSSSKFTFWVTDLKIHPVEYVHMNHTDHFYVICIDVLVFFSTFFPKFFGLTFTTTLELLAFFKFWGFSRNNSSSWNLNPQSSAVAHLEALLLSLEAHVGTVEEKKMANFLLEFEWDKINFCCIRHRCCWRSCRFWC